MDRPKQAGQFLNHKSTVQPRPLACLVLRMLPKVDPFIRLWPVLKGQPEQRTTAHFRVKKFLAIANTQSNISIMFRDSSLGIRPMKTYRSKKLGVGDYGRETTTGRPISPPDTESYQRWYFTGSGGYKLPLSRAAILSNEKFRGVRLNLSEGLLKITANNPEQEQAEEVVEVMYQGGELEIGFNVSYVLDVLNTLKTEDVTFTLADSNSSALIEGAGDEEAMYVVMPMRL